MLVCPHCGNNIDIRGFNIITCSNCGYTWDISTNSPVPHRIFRISTPLEDTYYHVKGDVVRAFTLYVPLWRITFSYSYTVSGYHYIEPANRVYGFYRPVFISHSDKAEFWMDEGYHLPILLSPRSDLPQQNISDIANNTSIIFIHSRYSYHKLKQTLLGRFQCELYDKLSHLEQFDAIASIKLNCQPSSEPELIHYPLHLIYYKRRGQLFRAIIDATNGTKLYDEYKAASRWKHRILFMVGLILLGYMGNELLLRLMGATLLTPFNPMTLIYGGLALMVLEYVFIVHAARIIKEWMCKG